MIINANIFGSGSGEEPYGFLFVSYPADAVLSVTNVHPLFEQVGVGQRLYFVKKPTSGESITCVATISKVGQTSRSLSITFDAIAQTKSVALSFEIVLYENGVFGDYGESLTIYTKKWDGENASLTKPSVTYESERIKMTASAQNGGGYFPVQVDLSKFTTLHVDASFSFTGSNSSVYVCQNFVENRMVDNASAYAHPSNNERGIVDVDITDVGLTDADKFQYVGIHIYYQASNTNTAYIYKVWLD